MTDQTEKPRFTCREVEALVRMHREETVPDRLRSAKISLMARGFICCTYKGYALNLNGKKLARHLTGVS